MALVPSQAPDDEDEFYIAPLSFDETQQDRSHHKRHILMFF